MTSVSVPIGGAVNTRGDSGSSVPESQMSRTKRPSTACRYARTSRSYQMAMACTIVVTSSRSRPTCARSMSACTVAIKRRSCRSSVESTRPSGAGVSTSVRTDNVIMQSHQVVVVVQCTGATECRRESLGARKSCRGSEALGSYHPERAIPATLQNNRHTDRRL